MKIVILGGGISGLSAAFYARKKYANAEITLIEKNTSLGGWMQTYDKEGFLFERGPRTFSFERCPNLLSLIDEVGLIEHVIYSDKQAKHRFLWNRGKLRSISSFLPILVGPLLREPFISKGCQEDESIYEFASRRLGTKIANTLIDAMTLGIYGGDVHKLSIRSCFPFLYHWEHQKGSLLLGALSSMFTKKKKKRGLFTLQKGMETLTAALAKKSNVEIHLYTTAEEIRTDGIVATGKFYPADLVICALGGREAGRLTSLWEDFPETDLGIVHLAFQGDILPKKGFGYLIPTIENENLLGMVWDSAIFPQQSIVGETRVTAMMRKVSIENTLDCMERHLRVSSPPIFVKTQEGAIPQFHVNYAKRLARFEDEVKRRYPSLLLLGNYLRGASVDACIAFTKTSLLY